MTLAFELRRAEDLLNLRVEASNLRLDTSNPAQSALVVENHDQAAYLTFVFPPQTIAEPAYFESSKVKPATDGSSRKDLDVVLATPDEALDPPGLAKGKHLTTAQLGHPSRLVFKVQADARIPLSMAGLLDWSNLELAVSPIAAIGPSPTADEIAKAPDIQPPAANETAIELPYRLVISPTAEVAWEHRGPVTSRGRTEMWHTRLALKGPGGITELSRDHRAPLRAIWSYDYRPKHVPHADKKDHELDRTAMSAYDRHQIVVLTSAFHGYQVEIEFDLFAALPFVNRALGVGAVARVLTLTVAFVPEPFEAEQMMLSPLGGWLRSRGHWTPPHTAPPILRRPIDARQIRQYLDLAGHPGAGAAARNLAADLVNIGRPPPGATSLDLSEWVHMATLGRDHYVRIVYEGELWGFRHRAALIKVTERKFMETNGIVGAYLMQRMFIVVRQPVKAFARDDRGNPLKNVRLTTLVTPDIADPEAADAAKVGGTKHSFWVEVERTDGKRVPFRFHGVATDVGGNLVDFTVPLMFVSKTDLDANLTPVATAYNSAAMDLRNLDVPGQKLLFAERHPDPGKANDNTQLITETLSFVVDAAGNPLQLFQAGVRIKQVQELLGTDAATTIAFYDEYVKNGFDAQTGVFAKIVDPTGAKTDSKLQVDFTADKAGGFATPNLGVTTLTRGLGPMAGKIADAVSDNFNPTAFFPKGGALLFGCFDLSDVLKPGATLSQNAPKMSTKTQDVPGGSWITATLDWEPEVKNLDLVIAAFVKDHKDVSQLKVHAVIQKVVTLAGAPADGVKAEVTGVLTNFQVSVLKSVFINLTEFSLHTLSGQKPDVKVKLDPELPIEFGGDLKFVEDLRRAIPPDLFGKGPSLDISASGIRAGFAFALPAISVGVFALKDVNLGSALTLPFTDGKPVFDFNVSERQHPFLLTVALFGGGGFFQLQLDTAGMKKLEAALEFGAAAAIDIGVASGEVHIMAGIYFSLQRKEGGTDLIATLGGYLRMGGSLSVLGLIKVSVEFNLTFTYDGDKDKAYGRATLTVCVEIAFFSKSVDLTVERAFGGHGDPKFGDLVTTPAMWNAYALAFA
jgi:hypothetical protein